MYQTYPRQRVPGDHASGLFPYLPDDLGLLAAFDAAQGFENGTEPSLHGA